MKFTFYFKYYSCICNYFNKSKCNITPVCVGMKPYRVLRGEDSSLYALQLPAQQMYRGSGDADEKAGRIKMF